MKKSEKRRLAARQSAAVSPAPSADECAVMEVAMKAGRLLLENGAEIFRVEETMERICRYYHVENPSFFVLSNGIFMTGGGGACFCILFGGSGMDSAASFLAGLLLYAYVLLLSAPYMSRMIGNVLGGVLASAACVALYALGLGDDLSHMIIGAIIPLIPGIPFTNGIRDLADGDYISGSVRLLDALVTFLCIATGVGVVIALYHSMTGGGLL